MKIIWTRIVGLTFLIAIPVCHGQQAPDYGALPYDYITGNLVMTELDEMGLEFGGSFEVANRVHVFADYRDYELGNGFDRSTLQLGGGYRWDLRPNLDLVAKLAFAETEIDRPGPGGKFDDEGLIVSGLLRGWITRDVELSGELFLDNSFGSNTETIVEFGGQFHLRPNMSVGGRLRVDDDDTTLFLGARFYFGDSARRRQQQ
jgi:hypothetical protein